MSPVSPKIASTFGRGALLFMSCPILFFFYNSIILKYEMEDDEMQ
jgi:hypothetical protein